MSAVFDRHETTTMTFAVNILQVVTWSPLNWALIWIQIRTMTMTVYLVMNSIWIILLHRAIILWPEVCAAAAITVAADAAENLSQEVLYRKIEMKTTEIPIRNLLLLLLILLVCVCVCVGKFCGFSFSFCYIDANEKKKRRRRSKNQTTNV